MSWCNVWKRGALLKVERLTYEDIVRCQKRGYFDEHLATLYSVAYGEPYLYGGRYLIYYDPSSKTVWLTLFELDNESPNDTDKTECFRMSIKTFEPKKVIVTSPVDLPSKMDDYHCETVYKDRDYQINLEEFDIDLSGGSYKDLRYRVNHAKRCGYYLAVSKSVTPAHSRIMALHLMKAKTYEIWDYQLYLKLNDYIQRFSTPRLFNVFYEGMLIGFDVVDALGDALTTPLGFYMDFPSIADFLMYEEIVHAKNLNFGWLDIGWACNNLGLEEFKRKWKAVPKFNVCMQDYHKTEENVQNGMASLMKACAHMSS
jgi:5-hydroxyisourate hydrolase-like protein (transthyretin family)